MPSIDDALGATRRAELRDTEDVAPGAAGADEGMRAAWPPGSVPPPPPPPPAPSSDGGGNLASSPAAAMAAVAPSSAGVASQHASEPGPPSATVRALRPVPEPARAQFPPEALTELLRLDLDPFGSMALLRRRVDDLAETMAEAPGLRREVAELTEELDRAHHRVTKAEAAQQSAHVAMERLEGRLEHARAATADIEAALRTRSDEVRELLADNRRLGDELNKATRARRQSSATLRARGRDLERLQKVVEARATEALDAYEAGGPRPDVATTALIRAQAQQWRRQLAEERQRADSAESRLSDLDRQARGLRLQLGRAQAAAARLRSEESASPARKKASPPKRTSPAKKSAPPAKKKASPAKQPQPAKKVTRPRGASST